MNSKDVVIVDALLKYPFFILLPFVLAYAITPAVGRLATLLGVVDQPGSGRINRESIPRGGGVAIFIGFQFALFVLLHFPFPEVSGRIDLTWWRSFFIGSSLILLVGLADDMWSLRPGVKLGGQIVAASVMFLLGVQVGTVFGMDLPYWLSYALTLLWFLAIVNAFNLIDGLDGLATGLAIVGAAGICGALIFLRRPGDALVLLSFIGACAGFLRFNFHPARIFLGDSGSMFLGFTLAAAGLTVGTKGATAASIGVPLLAVGIPIFDTLLAIWRRSLRRIFPALVSGTSDGVMRRDLEHLHHRVLRAGLRQGRAAMVLYGASLVLVTIGLCSMIFSSHAAGIFLIAFVVGTYVAVRHVVRAELWDSGSVILAGIHRPTHRLLPTVLYPPIDFLLLALLLFTTTFVAHPELSLTQLKRSWLELIPIWCGVPFIVLGMASMYSRVWSKARVSEFFFLASSVGAGILVAWGGSLVLSPVAPHIPLTQALLYLFAAVVGVVAVRALPRTVQDLMSLGGRAHLGGEQVPRVVVYGSGPASMLYLYQQSLLIAAKQPSFHVIGILDDDRNLRRKFIHGYRVLGGVHDLLSIMPRHRIDQIVLTQTLSAGTRAELFRCARQHGVSIVRWRTVASEEILEGESTAPPLTSRPLPEASHAVNVN